jgi:hypothetical protein
MNKNLKNSRKMLEMQEKIDFMFLGEIQKAWIAELLARVHNVSVGIDIRIIILIISKREK